MIREAVKGATEFDFFGTKFYKDTVEAPTKFFVVNVVVLNRNNILLVVPLNKRLIHFNQW